MRRCVMSIAGESFDDFLLNNQYIDNGSSPECEETGKEPAGWRSESANLVELYLQLVYWTSLIFLSMSNLY